MKIYLDTIGCRLNQAEIEQYARQFRAAGHELVGAPEQADLAVVNTCTVTAAAASDSRQKIRQAGRAGAGEIVVTGCWASLKPNEAASLPGVTRVVPNLEKDLLVPGLLQIPPAAFDLEPVERELIPGTRWRTRAFIKVQDGCDNHCTFCITTIARGPGRSRPLAEILADIRGVIDPGSEQNAAAQEIVLTGVHLGSWGQDFTPRQHLTDLVQAILEAAPTTRLRLSSLEPWDLDEKFFELWRSPRLCRHLHLPLQSGCAATLRRMARKISPESFAALVSAARRAVPHIAITTDIITGFPGETEAEFEDSLEFIRSLHFAGGHVFSYSPRPGTPAARLPHPVPEAVRKQRNARVRAALAESSNLYQASFIGQVLPVLWESATGFGPGGWKLSGLTDNYLRVRAHAPQLVWNRITPVRLMAAAGDELDGVLLE